MSTYRRLMVPKQANGTCGVCARINCDGECCDPPPPKVEKNVFLKAGVFVFTADDVETLDLSRLESEEVLLIKLRTQEPWITASSFDAIEILMAVKPSAAEGTRLRFRKHAWAFHNLVGHPVMQLLAWAGLKRAAIRFHDWSAPSIRSFAKIAK